ncbi:wolframin isoform X1 [Microplitis demolitor]|uniref:wolframin isoform X1 n=1 Tax=Microplitis demolitor TaxID=69319 RepID=UPI00044001FC|nr:wolframin isoform X1 [Microplitis demolitor]
MAGVVPMTGKPFRKQWFLHDGPRGSLRGLRSQLAEDGCAESQVVLAKKLLEEHCDLDVDTEENAKLAVYWLTKASEQGNLEATKLLHQCFTSGHGITEHNYHDAKRCLDMSQQEKLARHAARVLFTTLANGEDFITSEQLRRQLTTIQSHLETRSLEYPDSELEKITESVLVSAASSYSRGLLPSLALNSQLALNSSQICDSPLLQRVFTHPWSSTKCFYHWLLSYLTQKCSLSALTSRTFTLLLVLTYCLFGTESLVLFIPMATYYLSFIIMVIATFQMLHTTTQLSTFRTWSNLFISYNERLNPQEAEYQFCRNNLKPYGHFFLALLLNLMIYPVIAHQWTPQSEFTVIAFTLTLITLVNFSTRQARWPDLLVLFSFAVHVLAKYPYEMDIVVAQTWRFLDIRVPTFASYVVGNSIEFCLNFRAVFYLLIPAIFLKLAARDGWKGTYQLLIPHCVTLSWWQIAILSSQGATWYGLIRAALALVGMVFFLPIVGIASVLLPVIALTKYLADNDLRMRVVTALLGGAPFFVSWYLRRFNWLNKVQVIASCLAATFLIWQGLATFSGDQVDEYPEEGLTWEMYQNYCHQPVWEELPKAQVQVACDELTNLPVHWEGYVTDIKLKRVHNNLRDLIFLVPDDLGRKIMCLFGDRTGGCETLEGARRKTCEALSKLRARDSCNVDKWNRFEFEVYVKMKNGLWGSNAEIVLLAGHEFKNFSLNIYPGDKVKFRGRLVNRGERESLLGGMRPHVWLDEIQCLLCHVSDLKSCRREGVRIGVGDLLGIFITGVKTVLNFVLNPLVIFK